MKREMIVCDRCGRKIESGRVHLICWKRWMSVFLGQTNGKDYDLCPECAKELERWMTGGVQ